VANMGAEIAEVATTCFIITLVVSCGAPPVRRVRVLQRRLRAVVASHGMQHACPRARRASPSASCCCAWRRLLRATRSSRCDVMHVAFESRH
jgi:hypothetical protein